MSSVPRKPRPALRSSELLSEILVSRALVPKWVDPRQPDLFAPPKPAIQSWTERNRDGTWSAYLGGFEVVSECDCQADAEYLLELEILKAEAT